MPKKLQLLLLLLLLCPPDPDHLHLCPLCGCSHEHPYWQRIHRAGVLSGYPGSAEGDLLCSSAHGSRRTLLPVRLRPELALLLNARGLCPPDTSFLVLSLCCFPRGCVPPFIYFFFFFPSRGGCIFWSPHGFCPVYGTRAVGFEKVANPLFRVLQGAACTL